MIVFFFLLLSLNTDSGDWTAKQNSFELIYKVSLYWSSVCEREDLPSTSTTLPTIHRKQDNVREGSNSDRDNSFRSVGKSKMTKSHVTVLFRTTQQFKLVCWYWCKDGAREGRSLWRHFVSLGEYFSECVFVGTCVYEWWCHWAAPSSSSHFYYGLRHEMRTFRGKKEGRVGENARFYNAVLWCIIWCKVTVIELVWIIYSWI